MTPTKRTIVNTNCREGAWMDPYLLNIITQEVSDKFTTQVTQEIHNKFDQLVAMLSPSTENCPQTGFQLGPSVATDNTPAASMISPAIVETTASVTGTVVDTGNVCPNRLCLRGLSTIGKLVGHTIHSNP
jgi:hypothetical protein